MSAYLTELNVFPVKSAGGTSLQVAELGVRGLAHDREFMLITPDGECMTQRRFPRMALLRPSYDGVLLTVRALASDQLIHDQLIHRAVDNGAFIDVTVHRKPCQGVDQGDEAAGWFSDLLGIGCRLVRFSGHRAVGRGAGDGGAGNGGAGHGGAGDPSAEAPSAGELAYADDYPLLLLSEESREALNSRLADPLPMNRFRPNLVVRGLGPFGEDTVRLLRIGAVTIELGKPCARCVLTTVDQQTGSVGHEPLRTLASFRNIDGKILFGQHGVPRTVGSLRLGDRVEILEHTDRS